MNDEFDNGDGGLLLLCELDYGILLLMDLEFDDVFVF